MGYARKGDVNADQPGDVARKWGRKRALVERDAEATGELSGRTSNGQKISPLYPETSE